MNKSFRLAAAAVALASIAGTGMAGVAEARRGNDREIRNVIYLLGDGMGRTHVTAARERYYGADGKLVMETLPHVGQNRTYSIEPNSGQPGEPDFKPNYVTDSASAATAWASGVKTYNAALGVDGKGEARATVMELAKKAGYRTGNVSTAEITDATPAGQMSHVLMRGCQGPDYSAKACQNTEVTGGKELPTTDVRVTPVADQIARNGTADVIMGGGLGRFDAADEKALKDQGYTVLGSPAAQRVATEADMNRVKANKRSQNKVFALYNKGNLTIEKSKRENPASAEAKEPTVAEMTRKSIELLNTQKGKKGFYLQVEGALIDKRSHANATPPEPSSAIATSFPGLAAPSGDPTPSSMASVRPAKGTVVQAAGPFDNRFTFKDLRLGKDAVTGTVTVTSDISDLLELQVVAGFHDERGTLLGTARFTHHLDGTHSHGEEREAPVTPGVEHFHSEEFTIQVPQNLRDRAVSASVAVPVLVNE